MMLSSKVITERSVDIIHEPKIASGPNVPFNFRPSFPTHYFIAGVLARRPSFPADGPSSRQAPLKHQDSAARGRLLGTATTRS